MPARHYNGFKAFLVGNREILKRVGKYAIAPFRFIIGKIPKRERATWALVIITLLANIGMLIFYWIQTSKLTESNRITQAAVEVTEQSLDLNKRTFYLQWRPYAHVTIESLGVSLLSSDAQGAMKPMDTFYFDLAGVLIPKNIEVGVGYKSIIDNMSEQPIILRTTKTGLMTKGQWLDNFHKSIFTLYDSTISKSAGERNEVDIIILPDSTYSKRRDPDPLPMTFPHSLVQS